LWEEKLKILINKRNGKGLTLNIMSDKKYECETKRKCNGCGENVSFDDLGYCEECGWAEWDERNDDLMIEETEGSLEVKFLT
jgi:rRNA maturation endonuclease Nob1